MGNLKTIIETKYDACLYYLTWLAAVEVISRW